MTPPPTISHRHPTHRHPGSPRRRWISRFALLVGAVLITSASGAFGSVAAIASTPALSTQVIQAQVIQAQATGSKVAGPKVAAGALRTISAPRVSLSTAPGREPFGDYVTRLSFDVATIEPALVTAGGPTVLTITGTMTNTGPEGLTNLAYRFQRGQALRTTADVRQELDQPSEPTVQVQEQFTPIVAAVPAGGSAPFAFTTSIITSDGLAVTAPGVYPLMVNVNGAVTLEGGPLEARIGELHLLLTVMGVPTGTANTAAPNSTNQGGTNQSGTNQSGTAEAANPLPVNFVWPLVDQPHLGVGGVFLNEDLLGAISPGGRLSTLVNGLTDPASKVPDGTITAVIDPQLLDELDRMTGDYRVVAAPGQPQPSMTEMLQAEGSFAATAQVPPSAAPGTAAGQTGIATATPSGGPTATPAQPPTSTPTAPTAPTVPTSEVGSPAATLGAAEIPGTVAGTGQVAAASFLGRLRDVAARYPVLVLPYGDPDVVAMVRAGLTQEVATAVQHGESVAERVLSTGTGPPLRITSMAFPINGASDAASLAVYQADGVDSALLSESSVSIAGSPTGSAQIDIPAAEGSTEVGTVPVAVAQADVLSGVNALIDQGHGAGWAMRVNALTGVLAQQSLDGTITPAVLTPNRRWSPDAPGLRVLADLLSTLGASKVITGTSLTDLAGSATTAGTARYPEQAKAQELQPEYLDRISGNRLDVASLRQTLESTPQSSDPNLVLDPLDAALDAAASTAFRTDPAVGQANLATVEATAAGLRNGVQITSAGNSYTLASSTSPLVLTVQNNLSYDVPVRVQISGGERVGLTVSDPGIAVVPAGRSQQVKIPAEVTRSGQFQVDAQLFGPDGVAWGPPVQLSVESTAYGALTVILIIVAGGVLVLMVALRIIQRLRGKPDTTPGLKTDNRVGGRPAGSADRTDLRDVILRSDAGSTPQTETSSEQTPLTEHIPPAEQLPPALGRPATSGEQVGTDRA